jgi:hypothetical protein
MTEAEWRDEAAMLARILTSSTSGATACCDGGPCARAGGAGDLTQNGRCTIALYGTALVTAAPATRAEPFRHAGCAMRWVHPLAVSARAFRPPPGREPRPQRVVEPRRRGASPYATPRSAAPCTSSRRGARRCAEGAAAA